MGVNIIIKTEERTQEHILKNKDFMQNQTFPISTSELQSL